MQEHSQHIREHSKHKQDHSYYVSLTSQVEVLSIYRSTHSTRRSMREQRHTHHDGDVVAVRQRQGSVHAQHVELAPQEGFQVLRVQAHDLRDVVQAA